MSAVNPFPLTGDTVDVLSITPVPRGYRKEYSVLYTFMNPDTDKPVMANLTMNEAVAQAFRDAGHTQVQWSFTRQAIPMAHVSVVLGNNGKRYEITHVLATTGTQHEVARPEARVRDKSVERFKGLSISEQMQLVQREKAQAKRNAIHARFKVGEALHTYQRTENCYRLYEVAGEYTLMEVAA